MRCALALAALQALDERAYTEPSFANMAALALRKPSSGMAHVDSFTLPALPFGSSGAAAGSATGSEVPSPRSPAATAELLASLTAKAGSGAAPKLSPLGLGAGGQLDTPPATIAAYHVGSEVGKHGCWRSRMGG